MDPEVCELFVQLQNFLSPDQNSMAHANAVITNLIQSDSFKFLFLSAVIIRADEVPYQVIKTALILMGRTLSPSLKAPIELIANTFLNPINHKQRKMIKEATFRGLMFDDVVIRQQAAFCIQLILNIEKNEWIDIFPALLNVASSNEYPIEAHCGAIYCFRTILDANIFDFEMIQQVAEKFFSFVSQILLNPTAFPKMLVNESYECFASVINNLPLISDEVVVKIFEIIQKNIGKCETANLKCLLRGIYSIFKSKYSDNIMDFIPIYLEISTKILKEGEFDQQIQVIFFWDKIAQFENKQEISVGIIDGIIRSFFSVILTAISVGFYMKGNNSDDEEIDSDQEQMFNFACHCLSSFCKAAPKKALECVLEIWKSPNFLTNVDTQIIALIAMTSIIKKPMQDPLVILIETNFNNSIFGLALNDNVKISTLALNLIQKAIEKFGAFLNDDNVFHILLDLLQPCSIKHPSTAPLCCYIIFTMCRYEKKKIDLNDNYVNILTKNYQKIDQILGFYSSRLDSHELVQSSFDALSALTVFIPKSAIIPITNQLVGSIKDTLKKTFSNQFDVSREIIYDLQNEMIGYTTAVANLLAKHNLPLPCIDELIRMLFYLVEQEQTEIYEESLLAFSAIIMCVQSDYALYIGKTMDMLLVMLQTKSPGIIQHALITLSDLFRKLRDQIAVYIDPVFRHLIPMAYEENYSRELVVEIISTLSDITRSATFVGTENRNEFYKILMVLIRNIKINFENKADKEFFYSFYETILYAFSVVFDASHDDANFACLSPNDAFLPIDIFISMKVFDDNTFIPFFTLLRSIASAFGKKVQIKINSRKYTQILKMGANSQRKGIVECALHTKEYLKNI